MNRCCSRTSLPPGRSLVRPHSNPVTAPVDRIKAGPTRISTTTYTESAGAKKQGNSRLANDGYSCAVRATPHSHSPPLRRSTLLCLQLGSLLLRLPFPKNPLLKSISLDRWSVTHTLRVGGSNVPTQVGSSIPLEAVWARKEGTKDDRMEVP